MASASRRDGGWTGSFEITPLRLGGAPSLDWMLSMNLRPELVGVVMSAVFELKGIAGGEYCRAVSAVEESYATSTFSYVS